MNNCKYLELVKKNTPTENYLKNALISFFAGGLFGLIGQVILELYQLVFHLPFKTAGVLLIITVIILSSILTALGMFDLLVINLKSALIIPISGFAHSLTAAAMDYRKEGLVLGIGANIFKLAGSVLLYGIVATYLVSLLRLVVKLL